MNNLILPRLAGNRSVPGLPEARQLTIVGGAGAGKTRFLQELIALNQSRAFCTSAISAPFPQREESTREGSIDMLFRDAVRRQPYLKCDAVSELDKLIYMLIAEEFEALVTYKQKKRAGEKSPQFGHTRLDSLTHLWQKIFPDNRIVMEQGMMMFATSSGDGLIPASKLSQSEQIVLYYCAAVLYAMPRAVIFIDSPSLFLHPTVMANLWNLIEELRPDCTFVYDSVDVDFVNSRTRNVCIWVKSYDAGQSTWDYELIANGEYQEEMFVDLIGTRRPILFIEGDMRHSIDARLYPLVFPDCTVKPLGSCSKVIETVRSFSGLQHMHHLESRGVVDRDRRTDQEVEYLRRKSVMVADVAEIENLFLLEGVIRAMAKRRGKNPDKVFGEVKRAIVAEFKRRYDEQALQHVRYRIKREVEMKVDARFSCITAMELHLKGLPTRLGPRKQYNELRQLFHSYVANSDYAGILKVFNHKPMLNECGVSRALGYKNKDEYIAGVLTALKESSPDAQSLRRSMRRCFHVE